MTWDVYAKSYINKNNINDQHDLGGEGGGEEGGIELYDHSITWTIFTLTMTKIIHIDLKNHEERNYGHDLDFLSNHLALIACSMISYEKRVQRKICLFKIRLH